MISILIPCYDFNALPLVKRLEKEALTLSIAYEIICIDDGSFSPLNENNQQINALTNCLFIESKKNVGRIANRKLLSDKAQYNWLLFIDFDTMQKNEKFLETYLSHINKKGPVFGGWAPYQEGVGGLYRGGVGAGGAYSDYPQNNPTNLSGQAWPDGGTWGFAGGGGGGSAPPTGDQGADGGGGVVIFKIPNGHTVSSPLLTDPGNQIFADPEGDNRLVMFQNNTYSDITTTITFTEG